MTKRFLLFSLFSFCLLSPAQFDLNDSRTVDLEADQTVFFAVKLTATENLTEVEPILSIPTCLSSFPAGSINITYAGDSSSVDGNYQLRALSSWNRGQSKWLGFYVHLLHNHDLCDRWTASCGQLLDFPLQVHFRAANGSSGTYHNELSADGPRPGLWRVDHRLAESLPSACAQLRGSGMSRMPMTSWGTPSDYFGKKIFVGVDWFTNINSGGFTFLDGFGSFRIVGQGNFGTLDIRQGYVENDIQLMEENLLIEDENGVAFQVGPHGGTGDVNESCDPSPTSSWNFFDVTDVVGNRLPSINQNPEFTLEPGRPIGRFRKLAMFIVSQKGCDPSVEAFGGPTQGALRLRQSDLSYGHGSTNQVKVLLDVPSAWLSGSRLLHADYEIQWYYLDGTNYRRATVLEATQPDRSLDPVLSIPLSGNLAYQIEARIVHRSTGSIVSTRGLMHPIQYSVRGTSQIDYGDGDPFLDAGERWVLPFRLENRSGTNLSSVNLTLGAETSPETMFTFSTGAHGSSSGLRGNAVSLSLAAGQTRDIDLNFELIFTEAACEPVNLYLEVETTVNGVTTSYRRDFEVDTINCDDIIARDGLAKWDQNLGFYSQWQAKDCVGQPRYCADGNCNNTQLDCRDVAEQGFSFDGLTGRWTGEADDAGRFYVLESPWLWLGTDPAVYLKHLADFTAGQAGGVLEFKTDTDQTWVDLPQYFEARHDLSIYHRSQTFPAINTNVQDNIIGNRPVFMDMGCENLSPCNANHDLFDQFVNRQILTEWQEGLTLPPDIFAGANQVKFRFVFQQNVSAYSGSWLLDAFEFQRGVRLADDLFTVGESRGSTCDQALTVEPAGIGPFSYEWFTSLDRLIAGNADAVNITGIWSQFPVPQQNTVYYVRITDALGARRVRPIAVEHIDIQVPPLVWEIDFWGAFFHEGADLNGDQSVDIRDMVVSVLYEDCR